MRPLHVSDLLGVETEHFVELMETVARYVMKTGESVHVPGVGVIHRKKRASGRVGPILVGERWCLSLRSAKAMKVTP